MAKDLKKEVKELNERISELEKILSEKSRLKSSWGAHLHSPNYLAGYSPVVELDLGGADY